MKQPPKDVPVYETELSTTWFDKDGILNSISKPPKRTLANTSENFELVHRISPGRKVPILVYICNSPVPDKPTRDFVTKGLPTVYTAMAMISSSGVAKIIMNVLFKFKPPAIPMRSFKDNEEGYHAAVEWLKTFV